MIYSGKVLNGVVVLPADAHLPEGSEVLVEPVEASHATPAELTPETDPFLATLIKLAKPRPDWPDDYVLNHGHYVSGEPKKS